MQSDAESIRIRSLFLHGSTSALASRRRSHHVKIELFTGPVSRFIAEEVNSNDGLRGRIGERGCGGEWKIIAASARTGLTASRD